MHSFKWLIDLDERIIKTHFNIKFSLSVKNKLLVCKS